MPVLQDTPGRYKTVSGHLQQIPEQEKKVTRSFSCWCRNVAFHANAKDESALGRGWTPSLQQGPYCTQNLSAAAIAPHRTLLGQLPGAFLWLIGMEKPVDAVSIGIAKICGAASLCKFPHLTLLTGLVPLQDGSGVSLRSSCIEKKKVLFLMMVSRINKSIYLVLSMCVVSEAGCLQTGAGFFKTLQLQYSKVLYIKVDSILLESQHNVTTEYVIEIPFFCCLFGTVTGSQLETSRMCVHPVALFSVLLWI